MLSAVRRREYPVKTPTSIVFLGFKSFKSIVISGPASGKVAMKPLIQYEKPNSQVTITSRPKFLNSNPSVQPVKQKTSQFMVGLIQFYRVWLNRIKPIKP